MSQISSYYRKSPGQINARSDVPGVVNFRWLVEFSLAMVALLIAAVVSFTSLPAHSQDSSVHIGSDANSRTAAGSLFE